MHALHPTPPELHVSFPRYCPPQQYLSGFLITPPTDSVLSKLRYVCVCAASYRKAAVDIKISTLRAKEAGDKPTDQSSVLANLNAGKAALTSRYVWILGFSCLINFKRLHIHYKKLASSFVDYMGSKGSEDPLGVMANLDFGMADHDAGPMIGP